MNKLLKTELNTVTDEIRNLEEYLSVCDDSEKPEIYRELGELYILRDGEIS